MDFEELHLSLMVVRLVEVPVELEIAMQIIEGESFQANSQHTDHCWA